MIHKIEFNTQSMNGLPHRGSPSFIPSDALMDVRHSLVTNKVSSHLQAPSMDEHCSKLYATIKSGLESSLGQLKVSIQGYSVCHYGKLASFPGPAQLSAFRCSTDVSVGIISSCHILGVILNCFCVLLESLTNRFKPTDT